MKNRIYVGLKDGKREVFKSEETPTQKTHGNLFAGVIGPFRTRLAADFMVEHGANNPHCQTVAHAERLAKSISV